MEPFNTKIADIFALILPIASAILAIAAGFLALHKYDDFAALFGIGGALFAAAGIIATYFASRGRDERLQFWIIATGQEQAQPFGGFGS